MSGSKLDSGGLGTVRMDPPHTTPVLNPMSYFPESFLGGSLSQLSLLELKTLCKWRGEASQRPFLGVKAPSERERGTIVSLC